MANKTVREAKSVHGTNPQFLIEKIIRTRIYESRYWKEECFALTADLVVDKGVDLQYVGGIYGGNIKPTPFLCLTLKLLQLQPDKEIVIEFMQQENFKYIRALGAFYFRLTANPVEIYKYLEPLYNDYRKLRRCTRMGTFDVIYMDEFIDSLFREDRVFDVILPRITKRFVLEENGELLPRESKLSLELEENIENESNEESEDEKKYSKNNVKPSLDNKNPERRDNRKKERSRNDNDRRDIDERYDRRDRDHKYDRRDRDQRLDKRDRDDRYERRDHDVRYERRDREDRYDRDYVRKDRRRSRSHSRDRFDRRNDRNREARKSDKDSKKEETNKPKSDVDEIAEMNALRAKLGLKPLKM